MNPSKRFQRKPQFKKLIPTFCVETGEYVFCKGDCRNCENFKESMNGVYGKDYP